MVPRIILHTNLDRYGSEHFPDFNKVGIIPRVGEYINVISGLKEHFQNQKLPQGLEVVSVRYELKEPVGTWDQHEFRVLVELWYNKTEFELYTQSGHQLL